MKDKKVKQNLQILIHGIEPDVYNTVVQLATDEKRSVGKQAEYMISKFIDQNLKTKKSSHQ